MENFHLNIELFRLINSHHSPGWDRFFLRYMYLGTSLALYPAIAYAWFLRRNKFAVFALTIVIQFVIVYTLKPFLHVPRPGAQLADVHLLVPIFRNSFPSADSAMAFSIAFSLSSGEKIWVRALWFGYAALIAYERVYLGVHFPLDVTAGALIAWLSYLLAGRIAASLAWKMNTS